MSRRSRTYPFLRSNHFKPTRFEKVRAGVSPARAPSSLEDNIKPGLTVPSVEKSKKLLTLVVRLVISGSLLEIQGPTKHRRLVVGPAAILKLAPAGIDVGEMLLRGA